MTKKSFFQSSTFHFIVLILIIAACWQIGTLFDLDQYKVKAWFHQFPLVVSGIIFVLCYVSITFINFLAKDLFKIVGAVVFGAYMSTFLIWCAEMINVVILFHLSRRLGRRFIVEKFKITDEQIQAAERNTKIIQLFAFRSIPLIPFRFLDLGYGLTGVPFRKYWLIAAIASPVRIFWIQFVLAGVGEAIMAQGIQESFGLITRYFMDNLSVMQWSLVYLGVSVVFVVGLKIFDKVKKA